MISGFGQFKIVICVWQLRLVTGVLDALLETWHDMDSVFES